MCHVIDEREPPPVISPAEAAYQIMYSVMGLALWYLNEVIMMSYFSS